MWPFEAPGVSRLQGCRELLDRWALAVLDLVVPPEEKCVACGRPRSPRPDLLCSDCLSRIARIVAPICSVCGKPLRVRGSMLTVCTDCAGGRHFTTASAYGAYDGILRELIHRLKFHGETRLAPALGALAWTAWRDSRHLGKVDSLIAVPLAPERLSERGFNQASLLAEYLSRESGRPVIRDGLVRTKETRAQSLLGCSDRRRNARDAFAVPFPARVAGKRLLLVDDVLTTGATADSCAERLLGAGAVEVKVLVVANGHTRRDWLG